MPDRLAEQVEKISSLIISVGHFTKDYRDKQEVLDTLTDAMFHLKTCRVRYHSFYDDQLKTFRIDPLHFFERDGGLYLFVRATRFGHIRVLAVERIMAIELTGESFTPPAGFNPEALLKRSFGIIYDEPFRVKIRFSPESARYIKERTWAEGQVITDQPDGSVTLEMDTSGWFEVKRWILSFGSQAEVLEPEKMRDEVKAELLLAVGRYR